MKLERIATLDASASEVWAVVHDPLRIGSLGELLSVEELQPGTVPGIGARYRALLKVGPVPVGGNVEIIEYAENRDLSWTTLTGVDHRLRIRVRESDEGTRLMVRLAYDTPGVLGTLVDVVAFASMRRSIHDLVDRIVDQVEGVD